MLNTKANQYGSKEILKYVRVRQPKILDVRERAKFSPQLKALVDKKTPAKKAWARKFIRSDRAVKREADLRFDYFSHLKIKALSPRLLPAKDSLSDPKSFSSNTFSSNRKYQADLDNCLASLFAFEVVGNDKNATSAARLLSFVEIFPELHTVEKETSYPTAVFNKIKFKIPSSTKPKPIKSAQISDQQMSDDLQSLSQDIDALWRVKNKLVQEKKSQFDTLYREITNPKDGKPLGKSTIRKGKSRKGRGKRPVTFVDPRRTTLLALKADYEQLIRAGGFHSVLNMDATKLSGQGINKQPAKISQLQRAVKAKLTKYDIKTEKFCEAYGYTVTKAERLGAAAAAVKGGDSASKCFDENPSLAFLDTIRMLGHADLVRVNETFLKYTPGEISYIENILAGEIRKREVKSTKYFEELTDRITEEAKDDTKETSVSSKQDLSSQIESELNTRLDSDINTSVSGSGGGTIGVVDFSGSGSAGASVGIGIDSSFSSKSASDFSQEIISKAVENTKSSTIERRLSRTYSLFETLNSHEINNAIGGDIRSRNGIYCFLDKHICLTETVYGKRLFLMANICLPGRNLLCEKRKQLQLGLNDLGQRPAFDISVDDISPSTYKELVTRFKAPNVAPPPPPISSVARVYKTDTSNANVEKLEMSLGKFAEMLAPFFALYKRFLITDTIRLPDGYEVGEVIVTVNHGKNGISIPAHLPLKVAGGAVGSACTIASGVTLGLLGLALTTPLGIWQFEQAASPLLHYNSDSSNVSVCIGNETQDSPYYFFAPDFLMQQLFNVFGNFLFDAPEILDIIQQNAFTLLEDLKTKAVKVPDEVKTAIETTVNDVIANIQSILGSIHISITKKDGIKATFGDLANSLFDIEKFANAMKDLFAPLKGFIDGVIELFRNGLQNALEDLLSFMSGLSENSQVLPFYSPMGLRGELPVSLNTVAINPGITINLVACLRRTEEAMDKWRLETFESLYQAYQQQAAEYDSKLLMVDSASRISKSPGTLRHEEQLALKELIFYALNNYHGAVGNTYSLEKMNLFENAIDWKNMSYRLYNYGPNGKEVTAEKLGFYSGIDERRKAFLKALWAQALIPLQPHLILEGKIGQYFADGTFDFEGGFATDDLTALYQELIQERQLIEQEPQEIPLGVEIIPTDFLIIQDTLPENPNTLCKTVP